MDGRTRRTIHSYNRVAEAYNTTNRVVNFWHRQNTVFCRRLPGKRVLEIGCGAGRDASELRIKSLSYIGIDASHGLLRIARRYEPKLTFRHMDLYSLKFSPKSFDGIWTMATLLHVPKRRLPKVLRSMRRLVVDGGILAVSIKEKRSVDEAMIHQEKYGGVDRFFAFYTKHEFMTVLKKCGWKVHETFRQQEDTNIWLSFIAEKTKLPTP